MRQARDLTQMDLAKRIGIGLTRYWQIENGYRLPTPAERARLARVLKVANKAELALEVAS